MVIPDYSQWTSWLPMIVTFLIVSIALLILTRMLRTITGKIIEVDQSALAAAANPSRSKRNTATSQSRRRVALTEHQERVQKVSVYRKTCRYFLLSIVVLAALDVAVVVSLFVVTPFVWFINAAVVIAVLIVVIVLFYRPDEYDPDISALTGSDKKAP